MRKVVSKLKLGNKAEFVRMLDEIGMDFSEVFYQHDRVYVPRGYKRGANYPRLIVRTEMRAVDKPAKYFLILRRHIEDSGVDVVNETGVKDYSEAAHIVLQLGFEAAGEVSRQRQELVMGDSVKIFLDKVEGLTGYYAKIENSLSEDESVAEAREDLLKTFEVLGEKRSSAVDKSYAELIEEDKLNS